MAKIKKNGGLMTLPVSFARNNSIPIDPTAVWYSYDEMAAYAASNSSAAYVGQILGLVDETNDTSDAYIILNKDGELMKIGSAVVVDNKSIQLAEDGSILLKNFGVQYYKYITENGTPGAEDYKEAHYELQIVDENNPWKAGLEPKIASEDNELVLAWYEPNPTTIDGINSQVSTLQTTVDDLQEIIGKPTDKEEGVTASGIYAELETKATKIEVEEKIKAAISEADHLARKIVTDVQDIKDYIATHKDAQNYIFMVPTGLEEADDKYNEYIVVLDDLDEEVIEKVGDWEVNLDGYAKLTDLTPYAKKTEVEIILGNYAKISDLEEFAKLSDLNSYATISNLNTVSNNLSLAQTDINNLKININSLDSKLKTIEADQISLNTKVGNLETSLQTLSTNVTTLSSSHENLKNQVSNLDKLLNGYTNIETGEKFEGLNTKVNSLENNLKQNYITSIEIQNSYISKTDFNTVIGDLQMLLDNQVNLYEDILDINERLAWQEIK